jgi:hypothetical protein
MLCDGERPEREHEQAMRDYEREVREYRDRIIEYLDAWVAYDYRLHARVDDTREPVLVPAPIHPDDMEERTEAHESSEEIPF